ncbi:MAG: TetR/AcrR family transcriptional regulator [Paludibacter sp.]|nr:TetR/AcrR family transcriptional regulator [Paludibacter sp.]
MTKKEKTEATAKELFWKHGFKKVSVDEICKKAAVSRKTFYTYYPNKQALVLSILESLTNEMLDVFATLVADTEKSFSEKMNMLLSLKFEMNKEFSMEFINDFLHPDSAELLEYLNTVVGKSLMLTREFFTNAQKNGEMNPGLNIDFLLWNMQKQLEICSTPEALAMFPDSESMVRQISELMIYGVMKPEQR